MVTRLHAGSLRGAVSRSYEGRESWRSPCRHPCRVDPVLLGGDVRLLRRQRAWTQARLASEARVSRARIIRLEGGHAAASDLGDIAAVVAALGGYLSVRVLFQGEGLDRLRDRRHAALVDRLVRMLLAAGWVVEPEVSFNVYGERGAVDILAFHPPTGALLVIEVKTVVPDVGGMLATLDRKTRLAADIARDRGWEASTVSRVLVVLDGSTTRRRIDEHAATFDAALPSRTVAVRRWLRAPVGPIAGLLFLPEVQGRNRRRP
jgi:transcriptional regulator with XRE-family HTH domain